MLTFEQVKLSMDTWAENHALPPDFAGLVVRHCGNTFYIDATHDFYHMTIGADETSASWEFVSDEEHAEIMASGWLVESKLDFTIDIIMRMACLAHRLENSKNVTHWRTSQ